MNTCFWAILGVQNLNFIHVSSSHEKLYQSSLYDLIHPEEVFLAKRDLNKFIHSNMLGGSITRCRIKNDLNHMMHGSSSWIVVDIVMHVATNDFVLVFFHRPRSSSQSYCGDYEFTTTPKIRDAMIHQLRSNSNNAAERSPNQFLRILDDRTNSVLLSWPDHYPNEIIEAGAQMDFLNSRSTSSTEISCFHCVQKPIRINAFGHKIHGLVIEYGSILFVLTQVEKTKKLTLSLPSSPMYTYSNNKQHHQDDSMETEQHHYFYTRPRHPYRMARNSAPTSPTRTPTISHKLESLSLLVQNKPPIHHHHHRNQCQSCGTENSPEWRRGPTGHKTLCNACGLRYSRSIARQSKMIKQEQQYHQQHPPRPNSPILSYHSTTPPITYERNRYHSVL